MRKIEVPEGVSDVVMAARDLDEGAAVVELVCRSYVDGSEDSWHVRLQGCRQLVRAAVTSFEEGSALWTLASKKSRRMAVRALKNHVPVFGC